MTFSDASVVPTYLDYLQNSSSLYPASGFFIWADFEVQIVIFVKTTKFWRVSELVNRGIRREDAWLRAYAMESWTYPCTFVICLLPFIVFHSHELMNYSFGCLLFLSANLQHNQDKNSARHSHFSSFSARTFQQKLQTKTAKDIYEYAIDEEVNVMSINEWIIEWKCEES